MPVIHLLVAQCSLTWSILRLIDGVHILLEPQSRCSFEWLSTAAIRSGVAATAVTRKPRPAQEPVHFSISVLIYTISESKSKGEFFRRPVDAGIWYNYN